MKIFSVEYLDELTVQAQTNQRKRQHRNIHESYEDPCQRFFNAIEPWSYIRPHRHASDPRNELLIAVRGLMAIVTFDDQGVLSKVVRLGNGKSCQGLAVGAEVPANQWHTVIALESASVLLEVKAGPFDPNQPKDLAPWAPVEGGVGAQQYLEELMSKINWS